MKIYKPHTRNVFYTMEDTRFVTRYRFSEQVVLKILQGIEYRLEYPTDRNRPLAPVQQLLLALRFYATGSFQLPVPDMNISKSGALLRTSRRFAS